MLKVWMSHGDKVIDMPPGFKLMASTDNRARSPAWPTKSASFYGLQFAPGSHAYRAGQAMLERFVHEICGCKSDWNMPDIISTKRSTKIRKQVGNDDVILGLSGGVDSAAWRRR